MVVKRTGSQVNQRYARIAPVKTYLRFITLVTLFFGLTSGINAQSGASLSLRSLQTEQFPLVSGFVDARSNGSVLIDDLQAEDLFVFEDGNAHPLDNLRLVETGWRVAVAINPGEGFAIRDIEGNSRYQLASAALLAWAQNMVNDEDSSLSLIAPTGVLSGYAQAEDWLDALNSFVPDFSTVRPDLQALRSALVVANQPGPEEGVASAIWLITGAPAPEELGSLQELGIQASQQNIPINIWLVDSNALFESEEALALQSLALASGGSYFAFSGEEEFPNPENYFSSLGSVYTFQYSSQIRTAGPHEVSLSLESDEFSLRSQALSFDLDLASPSPTLLNPPSQILRAPLEEDPETLAPFSQPIEIIFEFPDNYEREIVRSSLYVNEERVAENRSSPFTRFSWDLSEYIGSQQVVLRVEVEDELGLIGSTADSAVDISVTAVEGGLLSTISRNLPQVGGIAALLAAGAVFVIFILSGRISPRSLLRREKPSPEPVGTDPLLDSPLPFEDMARPPAEPEALEKRIEDRASIVAAATGLEAAYLQPISQDEDLPAKDLIVLAGHEFLIGSDKEKTYFHIEDSSVQALHASIRRLEDGGFELADLDSEAGTWLNYAPITKQGAKIHDGDLIHIGRVPFRFQLQKSEDSRKKGENS